MGNVFVLHLREISAIDTDAVQMMKREFGEKRCRTIIDSVVFEITDILCNIERSVQARSYPVVEKDIERLINLSTRAGLVCITDIATDLADCLSHRDDAAIAAVTMRLIRVGEDSLFSLIEFTDRSII